MIAALIIAMQAATTAPTVVEDEIVVLARKLESVSVWVAPNAQGRLACGMNQSSGNAKIDAKLCETAARCVKTGAVDNAAVKSCIDARKPALLNDFATTLRTVKGSLQ